MKQASSRLKLAALAGALAAATLAGCAPLVVGGAMVGGALVVVDRRTTGTQVEDQAIELKAANRAREVSAAGHINATSYNRLLLLTGEVPSETDRKAVEQVATENRTLATQMGTAAQAAGELVEQVSAVVEENSAITEEMAASANEVTAAIENIALVSEENSASVEEVSASTEEMSAQVHEVAASVKTLTEMAQALQALVAQFKLADPIFTQPTLPQVAVTPAGQPHGWATPLAVVERNGYH